jgi:2-amino-4-hydroxy-6-hydroxymethyldihydropteridine diphosphokinase
MPHPDYGNPVNTLSQALLRLRQHVKIARQSSWYRSAPVPASDQPWFVNAVVAVETDLAAEELLKLLHETEQKFGRVRRQRWEARIIDLDLLAYHDNVTENQNQLSGLVLPHPYMQDRAFVLAPINEIAPDWRHPCSGLTASQLLENLPGEQAFDILDAGDNCC